MAWKASNKEQAAPAILASTVQLLMDGLSGMQMVARRLAGRVNLKSPFRAFSRSRTPRYSMPDAVAGREMLCGALWCLGGMLALAMVYAVVPNRSVHLLWLVAIVCGAVPFLRGLLRY